MPDARPPLPPFDKASARQKVLAAEAAWNTRDPHRVALAYTEDSEWRNRDEFLRGRDEIVAFLTRKWERELDYVLRKDLWAFGDDRIAVRFQYEWHDAPARGSGRTATSCGSSRPTAGCAAARRASTTSPWPSPTGASSARAPTATRRRRRYTATERGRRPPTTAERTESPPIASRLPSATADRHRQPAVTQSEGASSSSAAGSRSATVAGAGLVHLPRELAPGPRERRDPRRRPPADRVAERRRVMRHVVRCQLAERAIHAADVDDLVEDRAQLLGHRSTPKSGRGDSSAPTTQPYPTRCPPSRRRTRGATRVAWMAERPPATTLPLARQPSAPWADAFGPLAKGACATCVPPSSPPSLPGRAASGRSRSTSAPPCSRCRPSTTSHPIVVVDEPSSPQRPTCSRPCPVRPRRLLARRPAARPHRRRRRAAPARVRHLRRPRRRLRPLVRAGARAAARRVAPHGPVGAQRRTSSRCSPRSATRPSA